MYAVRRPCEASRLLLQLRLPGQEKVSGPASRSSEGPGYANRLVFFFCAGESIQSAGGQVDGEKKAARHSGRVDSVASARRRRRSEPNRAQRGKAAPVADSYCM